MASQQQLVICAAVSTRRPSCCVRSPSYWLDVLVIFACQQLLHPMDRSRAAAVCFFASLLTSPHARGAPAQWLRPWLGAEKYPLNLNAIMRAKGSVFACLLGCAGVAMSVTGGLGSHLRSARLDQLGAAMG